MYYQARLDHMNELSSMSFSICIEPSRFLIKCYNLCMILFFRLPALTSVPTTLDLALTGKTVKADKAKKLGIVDLLVSPLGPGK